MFNLSRIKKSFDLASRVLISGTSSRTNSIVGCSNLDLLNCSKCDVRSRRFLKFSSVSQFNSNSSRDRDEHKSRSNCTKFSLSITLTSLLVALGLKEEEADKDPLIQLIKRAILVRSKLDLAQCDQLLHQALHLARERSNDKAINYVYNLLADNYFDMSELEKAEELYKELLKRILNSQMTGKPDQAFNYDDSTIEISLQLAKIYEKQREFTKADVGFQFVHDNQQIKIKKMNLEKRDLTKLTPEELNSIALFGMILEERGKFYHRRRRAEEAVSDLKRALHLSRLVYGDHHHQTVLLINDVGAALEVKGDQKEAINYFSTAVRLGRETNHGQLLVFYMNLGFCHLKAKDFQAAQDNCSESSKIILGDFKDDARVNAKLKARVRFCLDEVQREKRVFSIEQRNQEAMRRKERIEESKRKRQLENDDDGIKQDQAN